MNVPNSRNQIPEGVRDQLPREAAQMRRLADRLGDVFGTWGYREVVTPGLEYLETVTAGAGSQGRREDLYQLFDRKGRTLALRPDMTTPIARVAATKMAGEPLPLRLSYFAPVYRHRALKAGSVSEIWQAGIELIGAAGAAADGEVVALACGALAASGLEGFKLGLGHVDFVEGIFAEAGVAPATEEALKEALVARDLVAFEKGVREAGLPREKAELLVAMASFQGSYEQAVARFGGLGAEAGVGRVARALRELGIILQLLEELGVGGQVSLDLGLTRSLGYYTGVVFEGYAPGVGSPVLGGGRYDNLLADFGGRLPATGFALELDRLLIALERQGRLPGAPGLDAVVECPPDRVGEAMAAARELRARGLTVEVDLLGRTGADLVNYARAKGAQVVSLTEGSGGEAGEVLEARRRLRASAVTPIH
ncbi:MAG TPA: ATP phosphoribosyltransferase regulatory subunit [Symbiobacteriaceae bacterium]|nr:ATP phosphoribosyltransferase regulatory subunit [Symbiobacteriaceae bacterium]